MSPSRANELRDMIARVRNGFSSATLGQGDLLHVCQLAERFLTRLEMDANQPEATPTFKAVGYVDLAGVAHWEKDRLPEGVEAMLYIAEKK